MLNTVLSSAVPTQKTPTIHQPIRLHPLARAPTRAATAAMRQTTAVARSPPRNHSACGWPAAASSLMNSSGSGRVRVKTIWSSQLE